MENIYTKAGKQIEKLISNEGLRSVSTHNLKSFTVCPINGSGHSVLMMVYDDIAGPIGIEIPDELLFECGEKKSYAYNELVNIITSKLGDVFSKLF